MPLSLIRSIRTLSHSKSVLKCSKNIRGRAREKETLFNNKTGTAAAHHLQTHEEFIQTVSNSPERRDENNFIMNDGNRLLTNCSNFSSSDENKRRSCALHSGNMIHFFLLLVSSFLFPLEFM